MQKIYFFLFLLVLSRITLLAQGIISGHVKDAKTGEAIIGANIVIQGTLQGSATDIEGNFIITNVKEGNYSLQASSVTYKTRIIPSVLAETAKKVELTIELHEDVSELEEVVVQGSRQTDTDFDLLRSIKESKVVVVGITSEQISKSLDRDAAQVLRRVPGITIRGDQFVQVRGLSERYNTVLLHNVYAPSVETDVRSFSFATLPSSQLEKMLVFKSPSADLPGDFAGGIVKVFTKSIPDENSLVLDYSTQFRIGTTFQNYYSQQKNKYHFTGLNTGYYDLPTNFPGNLKDISDSWLLNAFNGLNNDLWVAQKSVTLSDQRFSITLNRNFTIGKIKVGNNTSVNYSTSFATYNVKRGDFTTSGNVASGINRFEDTQYNQQIRAGVLFNWAFKINPYNTIELKNLYNQSSNDQFVKRIGIDGGDMRGEGMDKIYRRVYSGQIIGNHEWVTGKTEVEWVLGYNHSLRDQPDYKRYRYSTTGESSKDQLVINNIANPAFLGRFFSTLQESGYTGSLSIKQQIPLFSEASKNPELKVGLFYEKKERSFRARNIGYISGSDADMSFQVQFLPIDQVFDSKYAMRGVQISEDTKRKDTYTASNLLLANYLMTTVPITQKLRLDVGVRAENNTQKLHSYDDLYQQEVNVNNPITRYLPSANMSYQFTEKHFLRGAYGETLNRPEFRELAPFSFYDYNLNFVFKGNPLLKTAQIQNFDLRWEYYPSKGEIITAGTFYKNFINPIETIADPNFGGVREAKFDNPESAIAYGFEVEIKKSLSDLTGSTFLSHLNLLFNATFIHSQITLRPDQASGQKANRPLQGQAPYVFNSGIFYAHEESGWQINLQHNVVGKNIFIVGNENYADVYLMPRQVIDLSFTKKMGEHLQLKGGVSDILNQPLLLLQDGDNGNVSFSGTNDGIIQQYKPGQVISMGLSWRF